MHCKVFDNKLEVQNPAKSTFFIMLQKILHMVSLTLMIACNVNLNISKFKVIGYTVFDNTKTYHTP